jgi:hypothetical protein
VYDRRLDKMWVVLASIPCVASYDDLVTGMISTLMFTWKLSTIYRSLESTQEV